MVGVPDHRFSLRSARDAARHDRLDRWVGEFLASEGSDNAALAEQLTDGSRCWLGPVELPLNRLNRLAGPEGQPVLRVVDDDEWRADVDEMKDEIEEGWDPPPLIVSYRNGQLVLEDGNHRVESLRRAGMLTGWSLVAFEDAEQRDHFRPPSA
jgi:hypothetical protein